MNELIKQAAEDCHLKHGIGKTGGYYSIIVNHFLSFGKKNRVELVRVDDSVEKIYDSHFTREYDGSVNGDIMEALEDAYAIGRAMTAQDIYNRNKLGIPGAFETVVGADEAILAAIQEAFDGAEFTRKLQSDAIKAASTRIAELEKENQELREGHYANVTDAYDAGHEDGHYGAHGVILHKYLDSHDYYTKTFNNEK